MGQPLQQFGIDRLSIAERIDLIGEIWDSLGEADMATLPEWHRETLEIRRSAAEADPEAAIPWSTVKGRLAERS